MDATEVVFWSCAALVLYTYAGYPLAIAALSRLRPPQPAYSAGDSNSVSIVLTAHDEEAIIGTRVRELASHLEASGKRGEIVVVSDGSQDGTAVAVRNASLAGVRVIELARNVGKAAALSRGCAAATGDLLIFADARQRWSCASLEALTAPFAHPEVGAMSGELILERVPGVLAGVGLYWRYEKWLRRNEARLHSCVGVTGSISAVRRSLFSEIPAGTLLDDVYWPLQVSMQGYRVLHAERAVAFDRLPPGAGGEFRRKVRTLSGNFQLFTRLPAALLPWRNPIWWQFVSHKLLRLAVPWALLVALGCSIVLQGQLYGALLVLQLSAYAVAIAGLSSRGGSGVAAAAGSFLLLNAAAWVSFWVWISGRAGASWSKVRYDE